MGTSTWLDMMEKVFWSLMRGISTIKPAKIIDIDYKKCTCTAQPLTKLRGTDEVFTESPQAIEVPLIILSSGEPDVRATFPIKKDATCLLLYSDRDYADLMQTDGKTPVNPQDIRPFRESAIGALVGFNTLPNAKEISSEDIVIENVKSKFHLKPDGTIEAYNDNAKISIDQGGEVSITNQGSSLTLETSGQVTHGSGAKITSSGDFVTASGISLNGHVHGGVSSGTNTTDEPE
jgi:hypothetical protein